MFEFLGLHFTAIIIFAAVVHFAFFLYLLRDRARKIAELKAFLQNVVRGLSRHSDFAPAVSVDDQISRFIKDWEEALADPSGSGAREELKRSDIKDEQRPYLETSLETKYNVVRTAIESYPLLGILGTLFAMALALSGGGPSGIEGGSSGIDAASAGVGAAQDITQIIKAFNSAIWSTVWGLIFAVGFMLFNAAVETGFDRLREHRIAVQEIIAKTKQLRLSAEP